MMVVLSKKYMCVCMYIYIKDDVLIINLNIAQNQTLQLLL